MRTLPDDGPQLRVCVVDHLVGWEKRALVRVEELWHRPRCLKEEGLALRVKESHEVDSAGLVSEQMCKTLCLEPLRAVMGMHVLSIVAHSKVQHLSWVGLRLFVGTLFSSAVSGTGFKAVYPTTCALPFARAAESRTSR